MPGRRRPRGRSVGAGALQIGLGRPRAGVVIVRLFGDLDRLTCPVLVETAHEVLEEWPQRLIVALGQLTFLSVGGLRTLLEIHERAREQECALVLLAGPPIARTLGRTGLDRVIPVVRSTCDALAGRSDPLDEVARYDDTVVGISRSHRPPGTVSWGRANGSHGR